LSSGTTQNNVVDLSKICCHYPMPHTSLIKKETPFLLRLILNPLVEGCPPEKLALPRVQYLLAS
jgi:hypothetical protein